MKCGTTTKYIIQTHTNYNIIQYNTHQHIATEHKRIYRLGRARYERDNIFTQRNYIGGVFRLVFPFEAENRTENCGDLNARQDAAISRQRSDSAGVGSDFTMFWIRVGE